MAVKTLNSEKIVRAAIEIIKTDDNLTFSKLAVILGTHSQAIYNYYSNVRAIEIAMVEYFYNGLLEELENKINELGEKADIVEFALVCRNYGLEHYSLTRHVLALPGSEMIKTQKQKDLRKKYLIMYRAMLEPLNLNYENYLVVSRGLRNMIVGEVGNVGTGWFKDPLMSSKESFKQMIELLIENCQNGKN